VALGELQLATTTAIASLRQRLTGASTGNGETTGDVSLAMARDLIQTMALRQDDLLAQRTVRSQRSSRSFFWAFLAASILCVGGGFLAALRFARRTRERIKVLSLNAGRLARGEPLEPMIGGRDEIATLDQHLRDAARLLRDHHEALERSTRSLDTFFNISRDLFCLADLSGRFTRLNPAWTTTLGWTVEELCAAPFLDFVHPDDRAATERQSAALGEGEAVVSFENRYRCRDGRYRWLLWNARAHNGVIYASARDITQSRETMRQLDEANQTLRHRTVELEAANRELEAFSYSVSHDLRAPLRAIDGFCEVIEEDFGTAIDEGARDALRRVRAAATRMGTLIDALLSLSRVTRMDLQREDLDLSAVASSIVTERPDAATVAPAVSIAPDLRGRGDPRLVRILLQNLLDNAWKYTSKTSQPRIEVGRTHLNGSSSFYVRDNGAGFDMARAGKLFGVFQRLHAERDFDGTGIGLATVQRIIQRHGGRIWAEAAVGAGATFFFTLEPSQEHGHDPTIDSAR
jgi:PAS domain S-box-containing protein